jgi:hypothetical protein
MHTTILVPAAMAACFDWEVQERAVPALSADGTHAEGQRLPVDHRALGYESEAELVLALRARLGIPTDWPVSVYTEALDGDIALTIAVSGPEK